MLAAVLDSSKALNNDLMHSNEAASHPSNGSFFTWHLGAPKINWAGISFIDYFPPHQSRSIRIPALWTTKPIFRAAAPPRRLTVYAKMHNELSWLPPCSSCVHGCCVANYFMRWYTRWTFPSSSNWMLNYSKSSMMSIFSLGPQHA